MRLMIWLRLILIFNLLLIGFQTTIADIDSRFRPRFTANFVNFLKREEGFTSKPYPDTSKHQSIGYGHRVKQTTLRHCSERQAHKWLIKDILHARHKVYQVVRVPITVGQEEALISFVFNTGNLKHTDILKALNKMEYEKAAKAFHRYRKSDGRKDERLVKRRQKEIELWNAPN